MTTKIDDRAVPIPAGDLDSILSRVKGINDIWSAQETSLTYLDFPDNFPVREMHGDLLGYIIWDEASEWLFLPVTHDQQDLDSRERAAKAPKPPEF
jgi:hypothetical protein